MALSNSFFGMRRGSTKSHTYSVLKGQQVTKDRVTDIQNPKTRAQMRQRAVFAEAVKFYKHANQALFKFAFEDKTQTESDYNAFIRHNVARSIVLMRDKVQDETFPAIGNNWMLTAGSMPEPIVDWTSGIRQDSRLQCDLLTGEETTIGQLASKLIVSYRLAVGDILTVVSVVSNVTTLTTTPNLPPKWRIWQIILNPEDTTLLEDEGIEVGEGYLYGVSAIGQSVGSAFIFSRVLPGGGVKVSNSYLMNNTQAAAMVAASHDADYIEQALISWGAQDEAILKGSLAKAPVLAQPEITIAANPIAISGKEGMTTSDAVEVVGASSETWNGAKLSTSEGDLYGTYVVRDVPAISFGAPGSVVVMISLESTEDFPAGSVIVEVVEEGLNSITLDGITLQDGRKFTFKVGN